jgi:diphthine-ammonia ligase
MYQTVGQDAIELVAKALEVPLYRRVISGDAVQQGSEYGGRSVAEAGGVRGDETEDLFELLADVLVSNRRIKGNTSERLLGTSSPSERGVRRGDSFQLPARQG